ncbi:MAG: phosphoribosylformylglycinamidine synthase, partial [Candidatus Izimaplasma sp.]|nr:phosphoribosylformylglycinamidine synthase [Candidatus Izimaplasma bacterium]
MNKLRVFVERKEGFDIERNHLILEIKQNFEVSLKSLRYLLCYDIFDIEDDILEETLPFIFYEPNKDKLTYELDLSRNYIAIEYLPGQFDQRADSALQCIKLINPKEAPIVKSGIVITFDEEISLKKINAIKKYLINEVDSREKDLSILEKDDVKTT